MKTKRHVCLVLCIAMLMPLFSGCGKKNGDAPEPTPEPTQRVEYELNADAAVSKEETVYVNITPDGEVKKINVTDRLHTDMPQVRIEDVSGLDNIRDVKTFAEPVVDGEKLYWDMDSTDLYYSGTTVKELPMKVSVSYTLDGNKIKGADLAGKSGEVGITIKAEPTLKTTAAGHEIFCPMLFVCGMILPDDNFDEVKTPDGVLLSDGTRQLVFFAGVPGMNESLGLSSLGISLGTTLGGSEYTLTAQAKDFKLGNMMFVAVPFSSVSSLGPDDISIGTESIKGMLADVQSLMSTFSALNINELVQMLYGDAQQVEELINAVGRTAKLYQENKALLEVLDKYITEGNLAKLEKLLADMEQIDTDRLRSIAEFTHLAELLELLSKFDNNIGALAQFARDYMDIAPLFESLSQDLSAAEVKNSLDNLPAVINELKSLVSVLHESEKMLERMSGMLDSESLNKMLSLADKLENSISIDALTEAQKQNLSERMQTWVDFGNSYDIFTRRTDKMTSTVVFVYKSDAIG